MKPTKDYTPVVIFGKTYHLRGGDADSLRRLARLVDRKMREIAPDPASADGMKVAMLAAVNFAHEAERLRMLHDEREGQIQTVSSRLTEVLVNCLEENGSEGDTTTPLDALPRSR
jgi:cell division protein ZapA